MGRIAGDGSDILMVNGHQVAYQGMSHLRKDVTTAQAVQATSTDGYQKYFLESPDRQERVVVWADKLDFSFEKRQSVPQITVDGRTFVLVAQDEQDTGVVSGFLQGAKGGISAAAGATIDAAKGIITNAPAAGATAFAGFAGLTLLRGVAAEAVTGTVTAMAVPAMQIIGTVVAIGVVVAGVAGGIKGAMDASARHHNTQNIADVIDPGNVDGSNPNPAVAGTLSVNPGSGTVAVDPSNPSGASQPVVPSTSQAPTYRNLPPVMPTRNATAAKLGAALQQLQAIHR